MANEGAPSSVPSYLFGGLATAITGGILTIAATLSGNVTATFPNASITVAGSSAALTAGRVPYVVSGGLLGDSANVTLDPTTATGKLTLSMTTAATTSTTGTLVIGNGAAATSVGVGGGNVNAGGTLTVGGAATFSAGLSTTGATAFTLGLTASGASNSTVAGNFPAAAFRNLDVTNNNGLALFFQSYDTGSVVRTAAGIATTFTAKGASSVDGILSFYTTLSGSYGERSRISAAGNLLVGTTADTGLTGAGGLSIGSTTSASSSIVGAVLVGNGTAATNVAIGGGNVNAGGSLTIGGTSALGGNVTITTTGGTRLRTDTSSAAAIAVGVDFLSGGVSQWSNTINGGTAGDKSFVISDNVAAYNALQITRTTQALSVVSFLGTLDATSTTSASVVASGGISAAKALVVGTTGTFGGLLKTTWANATDLSIQCFNTSTTHGAFISAQCGNGVNSVRYAAMLITASETAPQQWQVGLNGSLAFQIRDNTSGYGPLAVTAGGSATAVMTFGCTLDASAVGTAGNVMSGGLSVTKNLYVGGTGNIVLTDTASNTATDLLVLRHNTSATPAANYGTNVKFQLKTSTTNDRAAFTMQTLWVVPTEASQTARVSLYAHDATTGREFIRGETSGTAPMIGFLGAAAIARQSLAAWTGTATRTTFNTATATLQNVAEALKALIDDQRAYGFEG